MLSMSCTMFKHTPFDLNQASIRLLKILPLDEEGNVHCNVRNGDMNEDYTCIYYVWVPSPETERSFLNGRAFLVRKNIYDFLVKAASPKLRSTDIDAETGSHQKPLLFGDVAQSLWIDALYIDQQSTLEKNHQVQQMGKIFSKAQRVIS